MDYHILDYFNQFMTATQGSLARFKALPSLAWMAPCRAKADKSSALEPALRMRLNEVDVEKSDLDRTREIYYLEIYISERLLGSASSSPFFLYAHCPNPAWTTNRSCPSRGFFQSLPSLPSLTSPRPCPLIIILCWEHFPGLSLNVDQDALEGRASPLGHKSDVNQGQHFPYIKAGSGVDPSCPYRCRQSSLALAGWNIIIAGMVLSLSRFLNAIMQSRPRVGREGECSQWICIAVG